jgi:parvulin-like peptidyl-prolyl isomerase
MLSQLRLWLPVLAAACLCNGALAQEKAPISAPPKVQLPPPPARTAVAATVNGKAIPEIAVYRVLSKASIPPEFWPKARPEILSFLVENTLVDQYLEQLKIDVSNQEVQQKLTLLKEELKKEKQDFQKMLEGLYLTEAELREQIVGALRWEKFIDKYANDKALRDLFDKNKNMFDGSLVRARHVLIKPKQSTKESGDQARAQVVNLKKQIEAQVAQEMTKVPAAADNLARGKARQEAIMKVFSTTAANSSECPSGKQGGDLGWFPRLGKMVEPFAQAAFALEPFQVSEPVATEFGFHIIMLTERKSGRDVKFEQVRSFVRDVYAERLREAVLTQMRPTSQVQMNEPGKK